MCLSSCIPLTPGLYVVKRVIGLPGDHIHLQNGAVYRNGEKLNEPYVLTAGRLRFLPRRLSQPCLHSEYEEVTPEWRAELPSYVKNGDLVVPPNSVFAMGDHRDVSLDSRYWGFVPFENVIGRPMFIYWSFITPRDEYERQTIGDRIGWLFNIVIPLLRPDSLVTDVPRGALMLRRSVTADDVGCRCWRSCWPCCCRRSSTSIAIAAGWPAPSAALSAARSPSPVSNSSCCPGPGLVLYNFVVADDPSYGAEPMLRADTVTAYLRLYIAVARAAGNRHPRSRQSQPESGSPARRSLESRRVGRARLADQARSHRQASA